MVKNADQSHDVTALLELVGVTVCLFCRCAMLGALGVLWATAEPVQL